MADLIHGYLEEVRTNLSSTLEPRELATILLETEQHLRERVGSLEELGLSSDEAQAVAIADFGAAVPFTEQIAAAHDRPLEVIHRRVLILPAVLGVFLLVLAEASLALSQFVFNETIIYEVAMGAILAFWVAMVTTSYRSRRFLLLPLLGISIGIGMLGWVAMSCTLLNLQTEGGIATISRWDVGRMLHEWQSWVAYRPETAESARRNIAATHAALDRGILHQFVTNPIYFYTAAGMMTALSLSGNLIGAFLGRIARARKDQRLTRA